MCNLPSLDTNLSVDDRTLRRMVCHQPDFLVNVSKINTLSSAVGHLLVKAEQRRSLPITSLSQKASSTFACVYPTPSPSPYVEKHPLSRRPLLFTYVHTHSLAWAYYPL